MEKYQIFISYRREGGDALAGRIADRLSALGYKVFFDMESMRSGTFNTQILDAIAQCDDFLLVLPPNALDRCANEEDWVRKELSFALKHNKNVIPIMMRGFEFPEVLSADIDKVRYMEGVVASNEYFDAVIAHIEKFLTATSNIKRNMKKYSGNKSKYLIIGLIVLLIALCVFTVVSKFDVGKPKDETSENDTVIDNNPQKVETTYNTGDIISFGDYEQDNNHSNGKEPIDWIVLDIDGNNYLLLSQYALDSQSYSNNAGAVNWENCSLRAWLNDNFFKVAFSDVEQNKIVIHPDSVTDDRVFCLSGDEANKYLPLASDKKTSATAYAQACGSFQDDGACGWWLKDSGEDLDVAARVNIYGEIIVCDSSEGGVERTDYSVRPAIWITVD